MTLPRLTLMPNRFQMYGWLGPSDISRRGYDVIDANVDLPALIIGTETKDKKLNGAVFIEHTLRNEIVPETSGHGLPVSKCDVYNRVYDQPCE